MIVFPNAKINIGLRITERRPDGYHNLETIFYPIPLQDALEVVVANTDEYDCQLHVSGQRIEGDPEKNLVVRAYRLLRKDYDMPSVDIYLHKHIPMGAGMGGGSADTGFMIRMLNDKFSLNLPVEAMERYAAQLGADCPFFIQNQPAYATGIGDILQPTPVNLKGYTIVIVKPDVFVSTKEAYAMVKPQIPDTPLNELIQRPMETWKDCIFNDFEPSVFAKHPELGTIKAQLYDSGAIYAAMSGSGSALFGIFEYPLDNVEQFGECFSVQRTLK